VDGEDGYLWALREVSFDVMPGQCMGIVGRNGSGKSTALKLATRILRPTNGRILSKGRVSALVELRAGFHSDLTGREYIFLNGSLLGLSKAYLENKFDDIVAFSELDKFIDMPVKHYSSGMYMRLGFSVAIHLDPDILIVDEILAVGDRAFQMKCIDRIHELKESGVTIVFVSHSMDMVRRLCTHLVWLEKGEMRAVGLIDEVAEQYAAYTRDGRAAPQLWAKNNSFIRQGSGEIEITAVRLCNQNGEEQNVFRTGDVMIIEMDYTAHVPIEEPEFGFAINTVDGVVITSPNNRLANHPFGTVSGTGTMRYRMRRLPLLPGRFLLTAAIHDSKLSFAYDYHKDAYPFRVQVGGTNENRGLIELESDWELLPDEDEEEATP
jgi:ABC-type polysaccharide/polyol phosphate transport system ATPase subunit